MEVAQRTSPTNIGLWLTAALAASDFGYLTVDDFLKRCAQTLATLQRLERYEGHLLNWYDTKTLQPLMPRYVSTVDSGNLLACLWVLEQGCQDQTPCASDRSRILARIDGHTIRLARGRRDETLRSPRPLTPYGKCCVDERMAMCSSAGFVRRSYPLQQLQTRESLAGGGRMSAPIGYRRLGRELSAWTEIVDRYLPWMETLTHPPDSFLRAVRRGCGEAAGARSAHGAVAALSGAGQVGGSMESILAWREASGLRPEVSAVARSTGRRISQGPGRRAGDASSQLRELSQAASSLSRWHQHAISVRCRPPPVRDRIRRGRPASNLTATTICSPANAVWPAWWRSRKATCRWSTGSR